MVPSDGKSQPPAPLSTEGARDGGAEAVPAIWAGPGQLRGRVSEREDAAARGAAPRGPAVGQDLCGREVGGRGRRAPIPDSPSTWTGRDSACGQQAPPQGQPGASLLGPAMSPAASGAMASFRGGDPCLVCLHIRGTCHLFSAEGLEYPWSRTPNCFCQSQRRAPHIPTGVPRSRSPRTPVCWLLG